MSNQEILQKIGEILCDEATIDDASELKMKTDFRNDLSMDSLEMVNLVTIFEEEFNISIDDSELVNIIKAEDAVKMIAEMLKKED